MPLGVFLRNENKLEEMVDILDHLHKYVPMVRSTEMFDFIGEDGEIEQNHHHLSCGSIPPHDK